MLHRAMIENGRVRTKSIKNPYSYVSMVDGKIETHKDWTSCEKRVKGKSKTQFKKVATKEDEDSLIEEWKKQAKVHTH